MKKLSSISLFLSALVFGLLNAASAQTAPVVSVHRADGKDLKPKMIVLKPGEGEIVTYDAGTARYLADGKDTGGAWSLVELTEMPGYKTRLHRHNYTDEAYYVLEGTLTAKLGDNTYTLLAGSYILIPHGTPHAQGNIGKVPVRVLLTMTPAGFEGSFRDRSILITTADPKDPNFIKKREELMKSKNYDREFLGDWNPTI